MDMSSRDSSAPAPDPSVRAAAEQALRLSEQSYRLLIEEAPYAICRATETGQLLQVNRSMLEMLGYAAGSEADLLMRDLPQIFVGAGFDHFREGLRGHAVQGLESRWLCRDDRHILVRICGRRVRGPADETLYFVIIAENITERKQLEARLAQAEKMQAIGQLAGGIAHDFNNLLTVINGYCDLLLAGKGAAHQRQYLEMIRQAGERASGLTQQLLAFSRKQVTRTEAVDINSIVSEVVRLSRRLIGENIRVAEDLCGGDGTVMADAAQIRQMLMNLVINARDAMPEGGELRIATSIEELNAHLATQLDLPLGAYLALAVSDSGIGMDESVRSHIFEPFFTTKDVGKGTGLGLSTVYGAVRQSRGAILVESEPGRGTTFRIYLPKAHQPGSPAERREAPRKLRRAARTVLVVEDEDSVRRLITDLLKRDGYDILEAANAQEALILAAGRRSAIHLLVTDMVMPGATGRELAERLRLLHPESKVVLVSGYSESLNAAASLDEGISYLQKPFTPEHLTRVVRETLG
jgi:PAS domain S-box-containing protein